MLVNYIHTLLVSVDGGKVEIVTLVLEFSGVKQMLLCEIRGIHPIVTSLRF